MKINIRTITYGGILSALILLATSVFKVPIPSGYGYINLGDGAIFAAAAILGPFSAVCAALGSGLADLIAGAPQYILATVLIKGCMGLLAGYALNRWQKLVWYKLAALFLVCEIIMIGGYFVAELIIYSDRGIAIGNLLFNAIQGLAGIAMGMAIVPLARKIKTWQPWLS